MKMKEFVDFINIQLKEYPSQEIKSIYDLESALFILNLKEILAKHQNDESNTSKKVLEPFITLLAERWNRILNSDAIEQYNSASQANRIARLIAMNLSSNLSTPAAKFLMPTLVKTESSDNKSLLDLKPHQFVMSDDNTLAIEIYPCLDKARSKVKAKNKTPLDALTQTAKGLNRNELSETERARVINHSEITKEYNQNLANYTADQLGKMKEKLKAQLDRAEYQVVPAYGKPGKQRLRAELYKDIKTRDDLFAKLNTLPVNMWKPYCEHMKANDFVKIMSNEKMTASDILAGKFKIDDILQDKELLSDDKAKNISRFYCLYAFYGKVREKGPYLQNMFGFLAYPFVWKKHQKMPADEQMLVEIANVKDLAELPAKLEDPASELHKHVGPLKNSDLGKFTDYLLQYVKSLTEKSVETQTVKLTS